MANNPHAEADREVLLKIHRQFSKDEAVQVLEKEVARLNFHVGELTSHISELEYELKGFRLRALRHNNQIDEQGREIILKADLTSEQKIEIARDQQIISLKADNKKLRSENQENKKAIRQLNNQLLPYLIQKHTK